MAVAQSVIAFKKMLDQIALNSGVRNLRSEYLKSILNFKQGINVYFLNYISTQSNPTNWTQPLIGWPYTSRRHDGIHNPAVAWSTTNVRGVHTTKKHTAELSRFQM